MTPTPDQARALGQRLVACPRFAWRPGMLDDQGRRVSWSYDCGTIRGGICDGDHRVRPENAAIFHDAWPDLRDDATRGAVQGLIEESVGGPVYTDPSYDRIGEDGWGIVGWLVRHSTGRKQGQAIAPDAFWDTSPLVIPQSREEALVVAVAALEAAP